RHRTRRDPREHREPPIRDRPRPLMHKKHQPADTRNKEPRPPHNPGEHNADDPPAERGHPHYPTPTNPKGPPVVVAFAVSPQSSHERHLGSSRAAIARATLQDLKTNTRPPFQPEGRPSYSPGSKAPNTRAPKGRPRADNARDNTH